MKISINDFGIQRLWEAINDLEDNTFFEESIVKLTRLYEKVFWGVDSKNFKDKDFIKNQKLETYFPIVKNILKISEKYDIFLDRPNDPLCCMIMGIYNAYMPQAA